MRSAVLCVLLLASPPAQAACFTAADTPLVPVYQQAPPPRVDGQRSYNYYPVTVAATVQIDKLRASKSSVRGAYWQWANHGPRSTDGGYKGNITPGAKGVQIRFSSKEAANACTMAQTMAILGEDPAAILAAARLQRTTENQTSDTKDLCILPAMTLPAGDPIVLDYEVQDDRAASETLAFLEGWAALVHAHGHKAILYPNALDGPSQARTQLTAVAAEAATLFDLVHVMLWSRNTPGDIAKSFAFQAATYKAPASKLAIAFELADTTMADARIVHELLAADKASAVNFWRNHAVQGGSCDTDVNRKIACIAFGRCS